MTQYKSIFSLFVILLLISACTPSLPSETPSTTISLTPTQLPTSPTTPLTPTQLPTSSQIEETSPPLSISNLALGQNVTTSDTRADNPAELAVDGINRSDNFWSSGGEPTQWIEIDLGMKSDIYEIRLVVYQYPSGDSLHRVLGRATLGDEFQELHIFEKFTEDGQILSFEPISPLVNLRYIRVETLESAPTAYVEWREIEIMGLPAGAVITPSQDSDPEIIFYNGNLITMEPDQPFASAIAIDEQRILAIGSDEEILETAGPATKLIDLGGLTVIPGFVDPHTHLLKDFDIGLEEAQQLALENGITTLTEMTTSDWFLEELEAFAAQDLLRVRVTAYLDYTTPCGEARGDWYLDHLPSRGSGEMLQISGVKIFADGGVCGLPAVSFEYPGGQGKGDLWFTQEELNQMTSAIHNAGYQVAIHAQGDRAIEQAQNAIEFALDGEQNILRHRIEHNPFVRSDLLSRYSEIGIVPTIVGFYPTCAEINEGAYSNFFGPENLSWLENWRDFVDANPDLHIAWHGDDPWITPINPLIELYSLVTRKEVDENGTVCEPPDWLAAHALTVEEALPMMTIEAAYAIFREDEVGSLAPGKMADLLILSGDPLSDPDGIVNMEVWLTMVGGETQYCAAPDPTLCP